MARDVWNCMGELTLVAIVTLTISGSIVILLRYFADIVVWTILFATVIVGFTMACYLSYKFASAKTGLEVAFAVGAVFVTIVTILIAIFIIFMRNRIQLVIAMFKEAAKAIADVPTTLFLPILVNIYSN